ncbi:MAG: GNAT family N-acetyltransferase [Bacteroidia bacterium]|nr:GNAT family N-acetyltransferase [Bacteroidia bacterium]
MNIKIRPANLSDLDEIQTLFVETIRFTCKADYSPRQIQVWTSSVENRERWIEKLNRQYFLVAEKDQRIVGFASLENGNYLDLLYVHKDFQRQGIANLLFQKIQSKARQPGFEKITSDVSKTARPFFEAKGFRVVQENKFSLKGVEITNYHMTL